MAESVVKIRIDSKEYDAKLKKATDALTKYFDKVKQGGGTLEHLDDGVLDAIKSMGRMGTQAQATSAKLNEMRKAFVELNMRYKELSSEERRSPVGKELSKSLDMLKGRIDETKGKLSEASKELGETGEGGKGLSSVLDSLGGKFGMSTKALSGWGLALAAAGTALKVAKDAYLSNEEGLDEWNAAVEASKSVYNSFLDALNTGDMSGFYARIREIINAANDAYNALDQLGTFNAFNQINVQRGKRGLAEAIVGYREGTTSKDEARAAGEAYKKELEKRMALEDHAYRAAVSKLARERGVRSTDLLRILQGSNEEYEKAKAVQMTGRKKDDVQTTTPGYTRKVEKIFAANEAEKLGYALRRITDEELENLQALGAQADRTGEEIAQVDKQLVRVLRGKQGGSGGGTTVKSSSKKDTWALIPMQEVSMVGIGRSIDDVNKDISRTQKQYNSALTEYDRLTALNSLEGYQSELARMKGEGNPFASAYGYDFQRDIDRNVKAMEGDKEEKKEQKSVAEGVGQMVGGIQNMVGSLEQLGVTLPEGMDKMLNGVMAVVSLMQGIVTILTAIETLSAADVITPFAHGGMVRAAQGVYVPGNNMSGDRVPALLNSGEVVFNRAQQGNLVSQMRDSRYGGMMEMQPYVDGEKVLLGVNNYLRRSGRGEIVTSKRG